MALGILDWGVGGVGAVARIRHAAPALDLVYASDSGAPPWGTLPRRALARRVQALVDALAARGASRVLVACHAASTVLDDLRPDVDVVGVIRPGLAALPPVSRAGVIGGRRTVRSLAWARPLRARGVVVHQRVGQPLSALVEAGHLDGTGVHRAVGDVVRPLRGRIDALVLACTHYPALAPVIAAHLPGVPLVDPVRAAVDEALRELPRGGGGRLRAWTTGDPVATRISATRAFGVDLGDVAALSPTRTR